jgi:hypothetical protein
MLVLLVCCLTCVDPHVHVVGHSLVEAFATVLAPVFLPVPVYLHVGTEVPAIVEILAALGAGRCELTRTLVNGAMIFVVAQLAELLATFAALEGFLTGVGPEMNLQTLP